MSVYSNGVNTNDFSDARLGIDFTTQNPISADMLADSFKGLSSLYRREVILQNNKDNLEEYEFVLYITKIESKCIYTELAAFVGGALPVIHMMDYTVTIDSFQQRLRSLILHFAERKGKLATKLEDRPVTLTDAKDFSKIIKAAGDGGIKIERKIYRSSTEYSISEHYEFTPKQVADSREGVAAFIEENTQKEDADFVKVSLYFDRLNRVNNVGVARPTERGTIDTISTKSLPVRWVSEMDDLRVKNIGANLFVLVFTVDVKVDYVRGKPVAYRVLKLHDWQTLDSDDHPELPEA